MFISFLLFVGETTLKINHGDYRIFSTRALNEQQLDKSGRKKRLTLKIKNKKKESAFIAKDLTTSDSVIVMLFCSTPNNRNRYTITDFQFQNFLHNNFFNFEEYYTEQQH